MGHTVLCATFPAHGDYEAGSEYFAYEETGEGVVAVEYWRRTSSERAAIGEIASGRD